MIRYLPFILQLALVVFCLIDCVQAEDTRVRNLPKWAWLILIILIPIVGPIAWLLAGRPNRANAGTGGAAWPATRTAGFPEHERPQRPRPKAPDDDPEFLRSLKRSNAEHEDLLRKWEEDLKRREDEFRKDDELGPDGS